MYESITGHPTLASTTPAAAPSTALSERICVVDRRCRGAGGNGGTMRATATDSLTYADLETMPDDGRPYELNSGTRIVTPAPNTRHQLIPGRVAAVLQPR